MKHRWFTLTLVPLILLAACGPSGPGEPAATPGVEGVNTPVPTITPGAVSRLGVEEEVLQGLTVEVWHPWYGAPAGLFEAQVQEFNGTNTWGILVRATGYQNFTELYRQAGAAVHGPDRPHVVVGLPEYAVEWHAEEAVVDLKPYVSDPLYGLSAAEVADFPSVFWEQDQFRGLRLGVPAQRTARFLLYNRTWAEELGFAAPPGSAEEFQAQACAANQSMKEDEDTGNDGQGGWLIDTHPITGLSWLLVFGGGAQEADGFRFLRPENIQATRFVKGLAESGCAWKTQDEPRLGGFVERSALFATASLEDLPDLARDFARSGSRDEWTVLPFLGPEGSAFVVYGSSYILLGSDEAEQLASWLFVRWLLLPENQAEWVNSVGYFPLQATTMGLLADYQAGHPQWAEAVDLLPQGRTTPQLAAWRTVRVALGDGFHFMFRVDTPVGQVPAILAQLDAVVADVAE